MWYYRLVARHDGSATASRVGGAGALRSVAPMLPVYPVKSLEEYPAGTPGSPDRHFGFARMVRIVSASVVSTK